MVHRDTMFEPLLAAFPAFLPRHAAFMNEWKSEADAPPYYILLGDLVLDCVNLLGHQRMDEVRSILSVVENWNTDGNDYVREAAVVGFLEGLQGAMVRLGIRREIIFDMLGPESRYWWGKAEKFWEKGEPLIDDRNV